MKGWFVLNEKGHTQDDKKEIFEFLFNLRLDWQVCCAIFDI